MKKTTFLFPGQGAQYAHMIHDILQEKDSNADEILELLKKHQINIDDLDSSEALSHTKNVQLSLLICSVVSAKMALKHGIKADYVAGNSIGAFAAAVIAESISFSEAIELVNKRGTLMQNAYPSGYGMMACIGFSQSRLENVVSSYNQGKEKRTAVYMANINTQRQIVLAGSINSLTALASILEEKGIQKVQFLKMNVPSHCVLLEQAAKELNEAVAKVEISAPKIPYLSNIKGRIIRTAEDIRTDLGLNIAHPVKWHDGMQLIYELGCRFFLEMFPSGVLTSIINNEFQDCEAYGINLKNWDTIEYRYNK